MFNGYWFCHPGTWAGAAGGGSWGWLGLAAPMLIWMAILVGTAALLIWVLRGARAATAAAGSSVTPIQALQSEYARGLITRETYQEGLANLRGSPT